MVGPAESVSVCQWSNQTAGKGRGLRGPRVGGGCLREVAAELGLGSWSRAGFVVHGDRPVPGTSELKHPKPGPGSRGQSSLLSALDACWLCWSGLLPPSRGPSLFQLVSQGWQCRTPAGLAPWLAWSDICGPPPRGGHTGSQRGVSAHYEAFGGQLQGSRTVVMGLSRLTPEDGVVLCIPKALVPGPGLGTWLDTPLGSAQRGPCSPHFSKGLPACPPPLCCQGACVPSGGKARACGRPSPHCRGVGGTWEHRLYSGALFTAPAAEITAGGPSLGGGLS